MSDLERILWTSALTVVGGVIVLALGQIVQRFVIDPVQNQARTRGEILYALFFYAAVYTNPGRTTDQQTISAIRAFRDLAGRLVAASHAIPVYGLWASLGWLPSFSNVVEAARQLTGISNSIASGEGEDNLESRRRVLKLLRLRAGKLFSR